MKCGFLLILVGDLGSKIVGEEVFLFAVDEFLFGIGSNVLNYSDYDPESLKKQLAQDSAKIHTSEKKDL